MFKPIAGAIAALAAVTNPVSAAIDYNKLEQKLNSIGVTTMVQQACTGTQGAAATYNPYTNVLCVTEATLDVQQGQFDSVLRHETVHVVQDCIAGMANGHMGSVTYYMSQGDKKLERELDKQIIQALVHSSKIDHVLQIHGGTLDAPDAFVEDEAYALEDNHELVFNLLSKCNPK